MPENTETTETTDVEQEGLHESVQSEGVVTESRNTESGITEGQAGNGESPNTEETFPRSYVEELRQENARYRQRAQRADDLAHRLHVELVRATGRLADPEDLPFDEAHLDDPETLTASIDALLARKPHLASRRPRGDVGQGRTSAASVDLASILRAAAG